MVVNGRGRSRQVEEWIATATGRTLLELWPQWYGEGELTLSDDERQLVLAYRKMSAVDRLQLLATTQRGVSQGRQVHAVGGSVAAGGDVNIGSKSGRRRK